MAFITPPRKNGRSVISASHKPRLRYRIKVSNASQLYGLRFCGQSQGVERVEGDEGGKQGEEREGREGYSSSSCFASKMFCEQDVATSRVIVPQFDRVLPAARQLR